MASLYSLKTYTGNWNIYQQTDDNEILEPYLSIPNQDRDDTESEHGHCIDILTRAAR